MPELPDMTELIITCEHGGRQIPARYAELLAAAEWRLPPHRSYDVGALPLARRFAARLSAPLVCNIFSRLLVDLNRSESNPAVFSELTARLARAEKQAILDRYHRPYRREVEERIGRGLKRAGRVVHLSVHSFTPMLAGRRRRADVGLLYDPASACEPSLCCAWQDSLRQRVPGLRVRRNYPYRGATDGLTRHLRRRYGMRHYAGIELELNQQWPSEGGPGWRRLQQSLIETFAAAVRVAVR